MKIGSHFRRHPQRKFLQQKKTGSGGLPATKKKSSMKGKPPEAAIDNCTFMSVVLWVFSRFKRLQKKYDVMLKGMEKQREQLGAMMAERSDGTSHYIFNGPIGNLQISGDGSNSITVNTEQKLSGKDQTTMSVVPMPLTRGQQAAPPPALLSPAPTIAQPPSAREPVQEAPSTAREPVQEEPSTAKERGQEEPSTAKERGQEAEEPSTAREPGQEEPSTGPAAETEGTVTQGTDSERAYADDFDTGWVRRLSDLLTDVDYDDCDGCLGDDCDPYGNDYDFDVDDVYDIDDGGFVSGLITMSDSLDRFSPTFDDSVCYTEESDVADTSEDHDIEFDISFADPPQDHDIEPNVSFTDTSEDHDIELDVPQDHDIEPSVSFADTPQDHDVESDVPQDHDIESNVSFTDTSEDYDIELNVPQDHDIEPNVSFADTPQDHDVESDVPQDHDIEPNVSFADTPLDHDSESDVSARDTSRGQAVVPYATSNDGTPSGQKRLSSLPLICPSDDAKPKLKKSWKGGVGVEYTVRDEHAFCVSIGKGKVYFVKGNSVVGMEGSGSEPDSLTHSSKQSNALSMSMNRPGVPNTGTIAQGSVVDNPYMPTPFIDEALLTQRAVWELHPPTQVSGERTTADQFSGRMLLSARIAVERIASVKVSNKTPSFELVRGNSLFPVQVSGEHPSPVQVSGESIPPIRGEKPDPVQVIDISLDPIQVSGENPDPVQVSGEHLSPIQVSGGNPDPVKVSDKNLDPVQVSGENPDNLQASGENPDPVQVSGENPDPVKVSGENPDPVQDSGENPDPVQFGRNNPDPIQVSGENPDPVQFGRNNPDHIQVSGGNPDLVQFGGKNPDPAKVSGENPAPIQVSSDSHDPVQVSGGSPVLAPNWW